MLPAHDGGRKLKLDLHTHCSEALGMARATVENVRKIVEQVRQQGLDGIAVTEHWSKEYGYQVKEIVERHFNNEVLIIPGREFTRGPREEIVELFLPDDVVFRFWVHPHSINELSIREVGEIHGIELENDMHNWEINKEKVKEFAAREGLILLSNSDAHYLNRIGRHYNEVSLEELSARARKVFPQDEIVY